MVEIIGGVLKTDDVTKNAMGGTELIAHEMVKRLDPELLKGFQIIHSRVGELDNSKKKVLVLHDLPNDPMNEHLKNGGYNKFDKLVFVSNWQMQAFINYFSIPWYRCVVMQNAINTLEKTNRVKDKVKLIYHTTPHRGLNILLSAFAAILDNIEEIDITLDVYSSFNVYGWPERDADYAGLFEFCKQHPKINYFGSVSNADVKTALSQADIFAYPSVWPETSCIALMEAMNAGLVCVHSNYAALPETAANWTNMYQYQDNERDHVKIFTSTLLNSIHMYNAGLMDNHVQNQKSYTDIFYSWERRQFQWEYLLRSI